ncbi:lactoylglutathione lyase [Halalkaliarchaeum desulfuricum]|uniref:Lactoylglutathione lyase n=1 Tax=Halalkaliarchaeum desulfuricum TaxID=2055893 RepID=A0A343TMD3_9EURY|nr:VOC family protein [Halalkaliarchaeum desulfuricum]AUX10255.1 lactoylglutathione lyase [Halalkaliarchaeum desulfuricum]
MDIDVVDMDHVAIRVTDLERSLSFYHDLLGMPVRDRDRYEAGEVPYVAVVAGGRHVHLVPTDQGDEGVEGDERNAGFDVGGEHLCLLVRSDRIDSRSEVEALLAELRERGIEVESGEPRKRYGAYGRAWAAYVRDPDGRRVELKIH